MSKISEQKALEVYPIDMIPDDDTMGFTSSDRNEIPRLGYIKGYDQAFQDFMEKAEEFLYLQLNNGSIECGNIEKLIDNFKKHMQNEM